ncbi:peptide-methionine (S)-S-oxide reductase [Lacibacter sp. MH-610]|jgi:peptide-methionine (S)-S-oxide reductase|uniref:peptide-methionine (S)-S-oxide reductase n=1 Tax=Chitinophagaceae TaxID=563835 RepID=UPI000AF2580E|nr:peptide-methionine (S)-S-oxide reductase [Chitinophagales bacterium]
MTAFSKIGFGGSCHWCTEGIFASVIGVQKVEQGWIASENENAYFSEAVIVHFDESLVSLQNLIEIHLHTHSSTSNHSMRKKYRSAVYTFTEEQFHQCSPLIKTLQYSFDESLITTVLRFAAYKPNTDDYQDYYYSDPRKPFCQTSIYPKLQLLAKKFSSNINRDKLKEYNITL